MRTPEWVWPTVRDERGRSQPICRCSALPDHASKAVREAVEQATPGQKFWIMVALIVALAGVNVLFDLLAGTPLDYRGVAARTAVLAVVAVVAHRVEGRAAARRASARCIREQICPGCGYDLRAIPVEAGLRICPECGGAWREAPP